MLTAVGAGRQSEADISGTYPSSEQKRASLPKIEWIDVPEVNILERVNLQLSLYLASNGNCIILLHVLWS